VRQEAIVDLPLALQSGNDEPAEQNEGNRSPEGKEFPALLIVHASSSRAERCGVNEFGLALMPMHRKPVPCMRSKLGPFASLAFLALVLGGCDRCGDPVRINIPGDPKSCYETTPQK
jgi:hypothetical protein